MTQAAPELDRLTPNLSIWHTYDPACKTDLFSTALTARGAQILIDPIRLGGQALAELTAAAPIEAIVITNANHHRAMTWWSDQFNVPIFARAGTFESNAVPNRFHQCETGDLLNGAIDVVAIEGAAEGEIALYHDGTLVVGDSLIHLDPYGFTFLPPKYCSNAKMMKQSLRQLLDRPVERIFFAHGVPLLRDASKKLAALLS